jgi:serine/threonine protein kinase
MTLERGTLLHKRYRIVEILGQGGMGSVYRAMDENLGVEVALKENLFTTDEYSRQFRLEAVILANLRHPNLPRVTDHFVIGEQGQYLVMDYIDGEDLRQRMERIGFIPEEDAIQIGAAMCDALGYLHSRKPPILHRDVKPGNVKITPEGHIFLVDFGLAKVVQGSQATTTGARAMTPGYSPPEQYGTARTDARTDIYSLGATLYAALCGIIPEDGLARAMDNAQLTSLRKRNSKISRRMAAAIEKAMAVYPEERFQTGDEFKKALLGASSKTQRQNGDYQVAPPPADSENASAPTELELARPVTGQIVEADSRPISRPRRKRNGIGCVGMAGLLALLLLVGLAGVLFSPTLSPALLGWLGVNQTLTSTPPPSTPTAVLPTNTLAPTDLPTLTPTAIEATEAVETAENVLPVETPIPASTPIGGGQGQIAFTSDRTGIPQIHIINVDGSGVRPATTVSGGACQPDWSPDGSRLVFVSPCDLSTNNFSKSSLYTVNADGSDFYPVPSSVEGDYEPAWSPDGRTIAFTSLRSGHPQIYTLNLVDGTVQRLITTSSDRKASQPAWSRYGELIVYTLNRYEDFQVWKMTSDGQGQEQIVRSGPGVWDTNPIWSPIGDDVFFNQRYAKNPVNATWLMKINYEARGGLGVKVEAGPRPILNVRFSPDGQWLTFNSVETIDGSIKPDIYIIPLLGGERQRVTTDPGTDMDPVWRPLPAP